MLNRLSHTQLLRYAGLFTWAVVGIPLIASLMGNDGLLYVFAILVFHSLTLFSLHSFYAAFGSQERVDGRALLKNLANPIAQILSAALMLRFSLGRNDAAVAAPEMLRWLGLVLGAGVAVDFAAVAAGVFGHFIQGDAAAQGAVDKFPGAFGGDAGAGLGLHRAAVRKYTSPGVMRGLGEFLGPLQLGQKGLGPGAALNRPA